MVMHMEENPQTTDNSGSLTPFPNFQNHQRGAFRRWETKESRDDQQEVLHSLLVEVQKLKKQVDTLEKDKVLEKLDIPPELAETMGIIRKNPLRLKRGMGSRPLMESEINEAYAKAVTAAGAARYLGVHITTLRRHAMRLGIWRTEKHARGVIKRPWKAESGKFPLSEVLAGKHPNLSPHIIRRKLFQSGMKEQQCENCGFSEKRVTDEKQPLLLDFIDGNVRNHNIDNLRILCYNCVFMVGRGNLNSKLNSRPLS